MVTTQLHHSLSVILIHFMMTQTTSHPHPPGNDNVLTHALVPKVMPSPTLQWHDSALAPCESPSSWQRVMPSPTLDHNDVMTHPFLSFILTHPMMMRWHPHSCWPWQPWCNDVLSPALPWWWQCDGDEMLAHSSLSSPPCDKAIPSLVEQFYNIRFVFLLSVSCK